MEAWLSLLIQVPLVGVFVWYSLEMQKRYQTSMDTRDTAYLQALNKITERLDNVENAVERIDERTQPNKRREDVRN